MPKNNTNAEQRFEQEVIEAAKRAQELYGFNADSFIKGFEKHGAARFFSQQFERKRLSLLFSFLADNGAKGLELTPEALVTDSRHTALFSDEQADFCLEMLLEQGFYDKKRQTAM